MKKTKSASFPRGRVAIDYETTGLHPYDGARPFIVGLEDETGEVRKYRPGEPGWDRVFIPIMEDPTVEKLAHGSKFELKHSWHMGIKPRGIFHDTMAKAVLVNEYQRINLDALSQRWLHDSSKGIVQEWLDANSAKVKKQTGRDSNYSDVPKELLETYLEGDLDKTIKLDWLWRDVEKDEKLNPLYHMEISLAEDIAKMEDAGFWIDRDYVHKTIKELKPEIAACEKRLHEMAGVRFNLGSAPQLSEILGSMGIDTGERNKDGSMKTKFELLSAMDPHPFIDDLVRWRGLNKVVGTYLVPFTQRAYGDVVHGSLWQYGQDNAIVTGRLSSSDPNLQNMPGGARSNNAVLIELGPKVRQAIVPPKIPGEDMVLVFFDYKQVEMVIFTCYSGEERTIEDIRNGEDIYVAHGKLILGSTAFDGRTPEEFKRRRYHAKELCLSLIYGMGIKLFARKAKLNLREAQQRRDTYFKNSPKTRDFMIQQSARLMSQGFVCDQFGRRYHVPQELAYKATNAVCQGAAATVMKQGILRARELEKLGFRPMFPVHDELIGYCPRRNLLKVMEEGKRLLRDDSSFQLPLEVEASWSDTNWREKREPEEALDAKSGITRTRKYAGKERLWQEYY